METFALTPPETTPSLSLPEAEPHVRRHQKACIPCRTRKVKCDRQSPCSPCVKSYVACLFPSPSRTLSRLQKGEVVVNNRSETEGALIERIRRLENAVKNLGGVIGVEQKSTRRTEAEEVGNDDGTDRYERKEGRLTARKRPRSTHHDDRSGVGGHSQGKEDQTGVVEAVKEIGELPLEEDRSWHINTGLLASLDNDAGDVPVIFDADSSTARVSSLSATKSSWTPLKSRDFPFNSGNIEIRSLHPPSSQIWLCWQIYVERVDPLVKILHKPTMEKIIMDANDNMDMLSKSMEALMFAIYLSAITSLTAKEFEEDFEGNKKAAIERYGFAVEQALARADFLVSQEIVNLQAFILFLICARCNGEEKLVWTLTGLAIRMAHSLDLNRDATVSSFSPVEMEARRRLWWQICCLDELASKYHDSDSISMEFNLDTKLPLNINDSDLDPGTVEAPCNREGLTDTTFCLIRYEVARAGARLVRRLRSTQDFSQNLTLADKERIVKECYQPLETKYLKYCSGEGPLYWLCESMARMVMAKRWLTWHHPLNHPEGTGSLSREMIDHLFLTSIQIVEISRRIETDVTIKKWRWLIRNFQEWLPRAFILAELCVRAKSDVVDRAWRAVEDSLEGWSEATANSRNGVLLARLMQKARAKKQEQLSTQQRNGLRSTDLLPASSSSPGPADESAAQNAGIRDAEIESPNMTVPASSNAIRSSPPIPNITPFANRQYTSMPWSRNDAGMLRDMEIADNGIYWDNWNDLVTYFETDMDYVNNLGTAFGGT